MSPLNTTRASLIVIMLLLTACGVRWPDHGHGGVAEHPPLLRAERESSANEVTAALMTKLSELTTRISAIQPRARRCQPGQLEGIRRQSVAIRRSLSADLLADAEAELARLEVALRRVELRESHLERLSDCAGPQLAARTLEGGVDETNLALAATLLGTAAFAVDETALTPAYRRAVATAARLLRDHPEITVALVGHADSTGTEPRNHGLGLERAKAVQRELIASGLSAAQITVASGGADQPIASNEDPSGRLANRRITVALPTGELSGANARAARAPLIIKQWHDQGIVEEAAK